MWECSSVLVEDRKWLIDYLCVHLQFIAAYIHVCAQSHDHLVGVITDVYLQKSSGDVDLISETDDINLFDVNHILIKQLHQLFPPKCWAQLEFCGEAVTRLLICSDKVCSTLLKDSFNGCAPSEHFSLSCFRSLKPRLDCYQTDDVSKGAGLCFNEGMKGADVIGCDWCWCFYLSAGKKSYVVD